MPRSPPPQVTGISPKEGPPGTRVTIRGENLGIDSRDLIGKVTLIVVAESMSIFQKFNFRFQSTFRPVYITSLLT